MMMSKNTGRCVALGGWFLGAVLFMNCCYSFVSDDAIYGTVHHSGMEYESRIGTLTRAWCENVADGYRPVVHLFVRAFTGCFDKWVFNACNTLMMGCFMLLLMRYSRKRWAFDFQSLILCVTLYVFCMCKGDSYLWCAGSLNYLWAGAGTLAFLIFRDRIEAKKPISTSCLVLAIPFIVLSGWLQESFSLPVCFAFGIIMLVRIRDLSRQKIIAYSAYLIGTMLLVWTAKNRAAQIPPFSISETSLNLLRIIASVKAVWVLAAVMVFVRDRKAFFVRNSFEFLVILGSMGLIMIAGFTGERCLFAANMMAVAVIVREIQLPKWAEIVCCCAMAMLFCALVPLGVRQKKNFDEFLRLYRQSSDNVTCHERVSCGPLSRYFHQAVVQWANGGHSKYYAKYFGNRRNPPIALSRELYDNLYLHDRFCCSSNRLSCPGEFYSRPEENTIVMPLRMDFEIPSDASWRINVVYDDSANSWIRRVRRCLQTETQPVRDGNRGCVLKTRHGNYLLIAKEPFSDKYIRGVNLPEKLRDEVPAK